MVNVDSDFCTPHISAEFFIQKTQIRFKKTSNNITLETHQAASGARGPGL